MLKIGHRGARGRCTENSLECFKKGMKLGADYIELDVHKTKDGELIVIHEPNLAICDCMEEVKDLTLEQIKRHQLPNKEKIPTLAEALAVIKNVVVEIKVKGIEEEVVRILKEKNMLKKAIVISGVPGVVKKVKKIADVKTGRLIFERIIPLDEMIRKALNENADYVAPNYSRIDRKFVTDAHKKGLKVFVWVVNDKEDIKRMKDYKVDAIGSDFPERL